MAQVVSLYRYPVKGLSPESLARVELTAGQAFPCDRAWAVAHAATPFDPTAPDYLPKTMFAMLMRNERLASLRTRFVDATSELLIARAGAPTLSYRLDSEAGRAGLAGFITAFLDGEMEGGAKVVSAPGHMFSDVPAPFISLINLASCAALSAQAGRPVDPLRFRANVYFDGLPAWSELEWLDRTLLLGEVEVRITKRTQRCAATNVNPATAERDMSLPLLLQKTWGHADNGVYALVTRGGTLRPGDRIEMQS
jgi:uncharacterized protein YcbX